MDQHLSNHDFTRRGNFSLVRAPSVLHLERRVDADPMLGICYKQQPQLHRVPDYVCQTLQCLWVEELQLNIDVWRHPLRALPGPTESRASQCSSPRGGQMPVPSGARPHLSYILTMHDNPTGTAQCLLELFRTSHEVPSVEYVIIDDGSTEDTSIMQQTMWRLEKLFHVQIKFKRNEKAVGYGPANSEGIHMASGKYIVLINSDMYVVKGWLTAFQRTFEMNTKAGIVGPMFLGDYDLITEAGGLIFNDGSAANYARGKEPYHEIYFMRKADYISAACVMLRKDTYTLVGGFDPQYAMGYYEDTDLAMAILAAGLEVIFQPLAVSFHQEGGTFGTESTSDLKRQLMAENKVKFFTKWSYILQDKHCPSDVDPTNAFNRQGYPKFLWIDDIVPEPDRDSGSIRNINLLRILIDAGYHVSLVPTTGGRQHSYTTQLRLMGVQVFPFIPPDQLMFQRQGKCIYDVIMVAQRLVYEVVEDQIAADCPGVPLVYNIVDLHFLRESWDAITSLADEQAPSWDIKGITTTKVINWLDMSSSPEAEKVRHVRDSELYLIDKSHLTIVASPQEMEMIRHLRADTKVAMVSHIYDLGHDLLPETKCEGRMGTLFVGNMDQIPNRQAIEGLIKEVLPLVLKMMPIQLLEKFRMNIVGSNVVPDVLEELFDQNRGYVVFHGQLSDAELYNLYGKVKVAVAPLLSGAGVKGKVNQAMQFGVPVVATPVAMEGRHGQDGVDCMVANNPEDFARKIVQLHSDCNLWAKLVAGGRKNMFDHFSIEMARPIMLEALTSIGRGPLPESLRGSCSAIPASQPKLSDA